MRALSAKQRAFVEFYLLERPARTGVISNQAAAARRAGYGSPTSTSVSMSHIGWRLLQDERVQAAVAEEARKMLRGAAPDAVKALLEVVRNPEHKDHVRGIDMMLRRTDPEIVRTDMNITHRIIDPEQEELEELRALRELGTPRAKMLEIFGGNRLPMLEKLEAEDTERRAAKAKVIEGQVVDG
jgi:hypothetical protein